MIEDKNKIAYTVFFPRNIENMQGKNNNKIFIKEWTFCKLKIDFPLGQ